jgi:hypothetical protein
MVIDHQDVDPIISTHYFFSRPKANAVTDAANTQTREQPLGINGLGETSLAVALIDSAVTQ